MDAMCDAADKSSLSAHNEQENKQKKLFFSGSLALKHFPPTTVSSPGASRGLGPSISSRTRSHRPQTCALRHDEAAAASSSSFHTAGARA